MNSHRSYTQSNKKNILSGIKDNTLFKLDLKNMKKNEYKNYYKSDLNGNATVRDCHKILVDNIMDIYDVLDWCFRYRETAPNYTNKNSSRSHSIFTLHIKLIENDFPNMMEEIKSDKKTINGSITFIDLAGSEKFADKEYTTDERFDEGVFINSSLSALSRVILSKTNNEQHIPYRDNKLTRALEP